MDSAQSDSRRRIHESVQPGKPDEDGENSGRLGRELCGQSAGRKAMSLTVSGSDKKDFAPIAAGVHIGVCYLVVDEGTHFDERYDKTKRSVRIGWEIPDERIDIEVDGKMTSKPRVISQRYTMSLHEKAILRLHLAAWRGRAFTNEELKGFDLKNLLGKACQIQIAHKETNGKMYANVVAIMALPKGMKEVHNVENEHVWFSLDEGFDIPDTVYPWIQERIKASMEYQRHINPEPDSDSGEFQDGCEETSGNMPF